MASGVGRTGGGEVWDGVTLYWGEGCLPALRRAAYTVGLRLSAAYIIERILSLIEVSEQYMVD